MSDIVTEGPSPEDAIREELERRANEPVDVAEVAARHGVEVELVEDLLAVRRVFQVDAWRARLAEHVSLDPSGSLRTVDGSDATERLAAYVAKLASTDGTARFELTGEIGQGGMGVVSRAHQHSLRREVAVKTVKPGRDEEQARHLFLREALTTAALDHPNVVPSYDLCVRVDGTVEFAMKKVVGHSWDRLLHPVSEEEQRAAADWDLERHLEVLMTVCDAVAFAHSQGVAHLDLKPANVMIGDYGQVYVMDWGVAVDTREAPPPDSLTRHRSEIRAPVGTPSYMAPELATAASEAIGPWTDVYLLGAILHELLVGDPPHRAAKPFAVLSAARRSRAPSFSEDVPPELAELCRRALARQPDDRWKDVAAFKAAVVDYRRHRESRTIATRAEGLLATCFAAEATDEQARARIYSEFSEAIAGFRQARELWPGNEIAEVALRRAQLAYARTALGNGDLSLASNQLESLEEDAEDVAALQGEIAAEYQRLDRLARAGRRAKRISLVAVTLVVLALAVGFFVAEQGRQEAEQAHQRTSNALKQEEIARILADRAAQKEALAREDADQRAVERHLESLRARQVQARLKLSTALRKTDDHRFPRRVELKHLIIDAAAVHSEALGIRSELGEVQAAPGVQLLTLRNDDLVRGARAVALRAADRLTLPSTPVPRLMATKATFTCSAFDPGGKLLAAGRTHGVAVWNATSGEPLIYFNHYGGETSRVSFSSGGGEVLIVTEAGSAELWSVGDGTRRWSLRHDESPIADALLAGGDTVVALTADGQLRKLSSNGEASLLNAEPLQRPFRLVSTQAGQVAMGKIGARLCVRPLHGIPSLYEVELEDDDLLTLSGDGTKVAVGRSDRRRYASWAKVWEVGCPEPMHEWSKEGVLLPALEFTADGNAVLAALDRTGTESTVVLLKLGELKEEALPGIGGVASFAVAPISSHVAFTCDTWSRQSRRVAIYDLDARALRRVNDHVPGDIVLLEVAPDRRSFALATETGVIELRSLPGARLQRRIVAHEKQPIISLHYFAEGQRLLSSSATEIKVWDLRTESERTLVEGLSGITSCSLIPGGRFLLSTSTAGEAVIWDLSSGARVRDLVSGKQPITAGCVPNELSAILVQGRELNWHVFYTNKGPETLDGTSSLAGFGLRYAAGSVLYAESGKSPHVLPGAKGAQQFEAETGPFETVSAFTSTEQHAIGCTDLGLVAWSLQGGALVAVEGNREFMGVAAPIPQTASVLATDGGRIRVWSPAWSGTRVIPVQQERGWLAQLATTVKDQELSPDAASLVRIHERGMLRIWDTEDGSLRSEFPLGRAFPVGLPHTLDSAKSANVRANTDATRVVILIEEELLIVDVSSQEIVHSRPVEVGLDTSTCLVDQAGSRIGWFSQVDGAARYTVLDVAAGTTRFFEGAGWYQSAAFRLDGGQLLLGMGNERELALWDLTAEDATRRAAVEAFPMACTLSADGDRAYMLGNDWRVVVVAEPSGLSLSSFDVKGLIALERGARLSPDGSLLACVAADNREVHVFETTTGYLTQTIPTDWISVEDFRFSLDGSELVLVGNQQIQRVQLGSIQRGHELLAPHRGALVERAHSAAQELEALGTTRLAAEDLFALVEPVVVPEETLTPEELGLRRAMQEIKETLAKAFYRLTEIPRASARSLMQNEPDQALREVKEGLDLMAAWPPLASFGSLRFQLRRLNVVALLAAKQPKQALDAVEELIAQVPQIAPQLLIDPNFEELWETPRGKDLRIRFFFSKFPRLFGVEFDAEQEGVWIAQVVPDGPAGRAGVNAGDQIVGLGGHLISTQEELEEIARILGQGTKTILRVKRGGRTLELEIVLGLVEPP